jgi:hypothetical protein
MVCFITDRQQADKRQYSLPAIATTTHWKMGDFAAAQIIHFLTLREVDVYTGYFKEVVRNEGRHNVCLSRSIVVCLFSWRYKPLWLYFHSPVAGFSFLVIEVS